jgi:dihydroflavonol-4-reductase
MTKVFLTGATGFLGGHMLQELKAVGCEVHTLSRSEASDAELSALGAVPVRAALDDLDSLKKALLGCEAVFHVAADTSMWRRNAPAQTVTNVQGTKNMLRAAQSAGVKAFVHTSSVSAYSHLVKGTLVETMDERGDESWINYERSKFLSEQWVRRSTVPWIIFQPSHILGPGDRRNWARLIVLVDREKLPGIPPGTGAFADVREIAKAQVRAWQRQKFGQTYLLGGAHASFVDFVRRVGKALGRKVPARATPAWALMAFARWLDFVSRFTQKEPDITPEGAQLTSHVLRVDSAKARKELDYLETPLDTLLTETLAWMRKEGMVGR